MAAAFRRRDIDRLFEQGVRLDNFMGWCVCSPTRAMLLTGRHPFRVGTGPEVGRRVGEGGNHHRRSVQGARLSHRHLRQVAQRRRPRHAGISPGVRGGLEVDAEQETQRRSRRQRARLRRGVGLLRRRRGLFHAANRAGTRPGELVAQPRVPAAGRRLHRGPDHRARSGIHSREQGSSVLLLRPVSHRPCAVAGEGLGPGGRGREGDGRNQARLCRDGAGDGQERRRHSRRTRQARPARQHHRRLHQRQRRDEGRQQSARSEAASTPFTKAARTCPRSSTGPRASSPAESGMASAARWTCSRR